MNLNFVKVLMILVTLCSIGCHQNTPSVIFEYVDPLEKVLPESGYFKETKAHADVARGEHASFQFVVRSNDDIKNLSLEITPPEKHGTELLEIQKGFVEFVKVGRTNPDPSKDIIKSTSGYFPDPIIYKSSTDIPFSTSQPIWISVKIPEDAETGKYIGQLKITGEIQGSEFTQTKPFSVEVFKPVITKTSLLVTNWFALGNLDYLNDNESVEAYSETYWKLSRVLAKTLADYRQNVAMLSPLQHTEFTYENGNWQFDFTNFNALVELFIEEGVIGTLEGGHLGTRLEGWDGPFGLNVPVFGDDSKKLETKSINESGVREFYAAFLPALMQNIRAKGWEDIYLQHIADEPITSNADSYIEISDFLKSIEPNLKVIEACHTAQLKGRVDVWVPQMNFLNEDLDFYKERQEQGEDAWFYTCLAPKGEYANRFIELPLIKTRLLHWVNHKYGIPGYLHWGFNFWKTGSGIATAGNPYEDASGMIVSSGNVLPGGDCWIAYPGKGTIYPSIRLEAMRDGIVDYELLKMYQEKFPEAAKELVGTTVYNFEHYDTNIGDFRKKRRIILEALSQ